MNKDETEEYYDYVIIGTGLAETAIGYILSKNQSLRILQVDSNSTYGSEFATLQYDQLEEHFKTPNTIMDGQLYENNKKFNIDLTPKLLLQDSRLKDFLVENEIHELVSFAAIKGSYLYTDKLHSVPRNESQSLKSSAVSLFQKTKVISFFWHVRSFFKDGNVKTKETMREEFKDFGLSQDSIDFIGHAIALNLDDSYLDQHPKITYDKIVRYVSSVTCFEGTESPYIYPLYGLSELCQAFARKSAMNGTIFMLNATINSITGKLIRIKDPNQDTHLIRAGRIISDPKYYSSSTVSKRIIRCIMILENTEKESRNIIFLKRQLNRANDVFCTILGSREMACPAKYEIGILSTIKETENSESELEPVIKKFKVIRKYIEVREVLINQDNDDVFFTRGVDESALMDNIYDDIESIINKLRLC